MQTSLATNLLPRCVNSIALSLELHLTWQLIVAADLARIINHLILKVHIAQLESLNVFINLQGVLNIYVALPILTL